MSVDLDLSSDAQGALAKPSSTLPSRMDLAGLDAVQFSVRAAGEGWIVDCAWVQALIFRSGAQAQAQAHMLAICLAQAGVEARVLVRDRANQVVGTARYFGRET